MSPETPSAVEGDRADEAFGPTRDPILVAHEGKVRSPELGQQTPGEHATGGELGLASGDGGGDPGPFGWQ